MTTTSQTETSGSTVVAGPSYQLLIRLAPCDEGYTLEPDVDEPSYFICTKSGAFGTQAIKNTTGLLVAVAIVIALLALAVVVVRVVC